MESRQNSNFNLYNMKTIYAFIAVICLFLATATADTSFNQILWSGSCLLISGISGRAFARHLTDEEKEEQV